jgi:hypothetical protein
MAKHSHRYRVPKQVPIDLAIGFITMFVTGVIFGAAFSAVVLLNGIATWIP